MGKGKKCRSESPSSSSPSSSDSGSQADVPYLERLNTDRQCPRYSSIVGKRKIEDDGVGLEDIDGLQSELERMLASAYKRKLNFEEGIDTIINWQDRPPGKHSTTKSEKRKALKNLEDERPLKKVKELFSSASSSSASSVVSISSKSTKKKNKQLATKTKDYDYDTAAAVDPMQQSYRNDIPDRFCQFIEAFCGPIKPEHVKQLEDILKAYDEESDLLKTPALGKHYSLKWAPGLVSSDETGKECNKEKKKGLSAANSVSTPEKVRNQKRLAVEKTEPGKGVFGTFTQRIISCLLDDPASALNESVDVDIEPISTGKNGSNANLLKGLNQATDVVQLEKRIRKELEEQGLLELDDVLDSADLSDDEDEILYELKHSQNELKLISAQNQAQLTKLLAETKTDLAKQEIDRKLAVVDSEVLETFRRILQCKQQKMKYRKAKEAAKTLKDRKELVKQLDLLKAPVSETDSP